MMCCDVRRLLIIAPLTFHEYSQNSTIPKVISSRVIGWLKLCTYCNRTVYVLKS